MNQKQENSKPMEETKQVAQNDIEKANVQNNSNENIGKIIEIDNEIKTIEDSVKDYD